MSQKQTMTPTINETSFPSLPIWRYKALRIERSPQAEQSRMTLCYKLFQRRESYTFVCCSRLLRFDKSERHRGFEAGARYDIPECVPYRTRDHVLQSTKLSSKKPFADLSALCR